MQCHAKGQGLAIDFLFAAMIFLLLLNAALNVWSNEAGFVQKEYLLSELENKASPAIDLLVRTNGEPPDWEERDINQTKIIGLAKSDRVLEPDKVRLFAQWGSAFWSVDYNKLKEKMFLSYDFYFKLSDETGTVIEETEKPPATFLGKVWSVNVKRIVKYGEGAGIVELTLYHPR